jgi:hypothetical protein
MALKSLKIVTMEGAFKLRSIMDFSISSIPTRVEVSSFKNLRKFYFRLTLRKTVESLG